MKNVQTFLDKSAISISLLCIAHCLLLPIAVTIIPVLSVLPLQDELFHRLLVIAILPTSLIGLVIGCRKHKRWRIASYGIFGVVMVIVAALFGHDLVGEFGENSNYWGHNIKNFFERNNIGWSWWNFLN